MFNPRYDAGAVYHAGIVYIFGGAVVGAFSASGESEAYTVDDDTWKRLPACPFASYSVNAVVMNDMIYITGNSFTDVVEFNPYTEIYRNMNVALGGADKAVLTDGAFLYVLTSAGGKVIDSEGTEHGAISYNYADGSGWTAVQHS
jgi:hypothetical protein